MGFLQGINFEVIPSKYEENLDPEEFPSHGEFVMKTAYNKVIEVAQRIANISKHIVLIGSDTVVTLNGKVYGKPKDEKEAYQFLNEWVPV